MKMERRWHWLFCLNFLLFAALGSSGHEPGWDFPPDIYPMTGATPKSIVAGNGVVYTADSVVSQWTESDGWRDLSDPGSGLQFNRLFLKGDTLYGAGLFQNPEDSSVSSFVYKCDLTTGTWSQVGDLLPETPLIQCIAVDASDRVYVGFGAYVDEEGFGQNTEMLKQWDSEAHDWVTVGNGFYAEPDKFFLSFEGVTALAVDGNDLYVGGSFSGGMNNPGYTPEEVDSQAFIKWDGTRWIAVASGIPN